MLKDTLCPGRHGVLTLGEAVRLTKGRIHEVQGDSADCFALAVAASLRGPVIWIGSAPDIASLNPSAVRDFMDPLRLTVIEAVSRQECLWSGEQALRAQGIACVVIELAHGTDLKESRRLQLAAEENGALGLVMISEHARTSAAETRWRCDPSADGEVAWDWECTKNRKGELGAWRVKWLGDDDGPSIVHLVATTAT
ncbi:MAG: hypothetical protein OXE82_04075 [Rhodobacter sp.]|nr:hypothetical protein [Rhodobacter sp.]